MPLLKVSFEPAAAFLRSPVYADMKRYAEEIGKILPPHVTAAPDVAAAIAHQRAGFEAAFLAFERTIHAPPVESLAEADKGEPAQNSPIVARIAAEEGVTPQDVIQSFHTD